MVCQLPPPLTEEEIESLLDGITRQDLTDHLAQCPACATRLQQAQAFHTALEQRLHRWNCPDANTLADYQMDLLPSADQQRVAEHIAACAYCQVEIATLRDFLASPDAPPLQPTAKPPVNTASRISKLPHAYLARVSAAQQMAALRGKTSGPIMAETENGITLFLELHSEPLGLLLIGQLVASNQDLWTDAIVQLFQADQFVATGFVNELGEFQCKLIDSSPITLRIRAGSGQATGIDDLDFEGHVADGR